MKRNIKGFRNSFIGLVVIVLLFSSCSKSDEADVIFYELQGVEHQVNINYLLQAIEVKFSPDVKKSGIYLAEFELSEGASMFRNEKLQESGVTEVDFSYDFSYKVLAEDGESELTWKLGSVNNSFTKDWGLGRFLNQQISNNRDYDFYLDQLRTGEFSSVNCGPTVITMAMKWANEDFTGTPEDARAAYRSDGGGWYTSDMHKYLDDHEVAHYFTVLGEEADLSARIFQEIINGGDVAILCVDMYYIREAISSTYRTDKFYHTDGVDWGHFLLLKGWIEVDGELYMEVYDPNSWGRIYKDGDLKGKDRYYRAEDLFAACKIWWNCAIVIPDDGITEKKRGIDISEIEDAWGR